MAKSSTSPTQRTLKALRDRGYTVQVVERWNQYAKVRVDLFGGIDLIAIKEDRILGVQATSNDNAAARVAKLIAEPRMAEWLRAGGLLEVWGWRKIKAGTKRLTWQPSIRQLLLVGGEVIELSKGNP